MNSHQLKFVLVILFNWELINWSRAVHRVGKDLKFLEVDNIWGQIIIQKRAKIRRLGMYITPLIPISDSHLDLA